MDIQTARGDFIEHAEFSGNKYGTSIAEVQRIASLGKICLLEIDLVGVNTLERRLQRAQEELQAAQQMSWDLQLVNDTEEEAWKELRDAVGRWFCLPLETKE
ncbi:guanylate kinase, putative [Eimeria mitis]|uniref:Guanylate kinase, putative n=1 Tax=Eimeria mitis TaxID=44415 RepID=U6JRC8_9EIME|nr:guanylate kinase, putative [Eimeria mitis]CDJ27989.1 guanylate kinase, putative [Eimeria mitis]